MDLVGSECCKIPKTNREFWVAKIATGSDGVALHHGVGVWTESVETGRNAGVDSVYAEPSLVAG